MTVKTDELIQILAQSPRPKEPLSFAALSVLLMLASLLATNFFLGVRPELSGGPVAGADEFDFPLFLKVFATAPATFYFKSALLLGTVACGLVFIKRVSNPLPDPQPTIIFGLMPTIFAILILFEWTKTSSTDEIVELFLLPNFKSCLTYVTLYGLAGIVAFTALMKKYAPSDERQAAALIGFGSASAGAVGYSIHCPIDSPTFVAIAYGIPVMTLTILSLLVIPRFIRW